MEQIALSIESASYGSQGQTPIQKERLLTEIAPTGAYCMFEVARHKIIVFGPHWPLFIFTFICFTIASVIFVQKSDQFLWPILVSVFQLLSYLIIGISEPGFVNDLSLNTKYKNVIYDLPTRPQKIWYCFKCQMIQEEHTAHCDFCKICIRGYDHHCPWTGKCIGRGNIFQFYLFITSTMTYFTYFIYFNIK